MNLDHAAAWGRAIAFSLRTQGENNPFLLAAKWGWRVVLEVEDDGDALVPARLAEWDGRRRMIRLYLPTLRRYLDESIAVLHRACAHELFHGLVALKYRPLSRTVDDIPLLKFNDEEKAAQVFAELLPSHQLEEESCPPLASRLSSSFSPLPR